MVTDRSTARGAIRDYLLVLRCQAGDEKAFRDLFERYGHRTLRYLKGLVDDHSAEDVQQEVWLTVYRKIGELANPRAFRTWLFMTARHRAIDFLRREERHLELLEAAARENGFGFDEAVEVMVIQAEDPSLAAAMAKLSPAHQDVLRLRFWERMAYGEIALVVGCSIGTVRSRIHHAKRQLRHALGGVT